MDLSTLIRLKALIVLGLLAASCAGIHDGSGGSNEVLPGDANLVVTAQFTSNYPGITGGGTASVYSSTSEGLLLDIGGFTVPSESGLEVIVTSGSNSATFALQYTSGTNQIYNLTFQPTSVQIYSTQHSTAYLIAGA
jgi:hypothetical protein